MVHSYIYIWFTRLKNGGSFHGELLNNQRVNGNFIWIFRGMETMVIFQNDPSMGEILGISNSMGILLLGISCVCNGSKQGTIGIQWGFNVDVMGI